MLILAMETSGPTASAALLRDGQLIAEQAMHHTRTHSETILPMAETLMRDMGCTPSILNALAVNKGPGSFTGIRIGVCIANAMASSLHIPVYGINAFEALYHNAAYCRGNVCVMIDARNNSAYMAQFQNGTMIEKPTVCIVDEYLEMVPAGTVFIGDGAAAYRTEIESRVEQALFLPPSFSLSRAGSLCEIAFMRAQAGDNGKSVTEPVYMRPSQAERLYQKTRLEKEDGHGM